MAPKLQKKHPNYSILCGLRGDDSSSSSTSPTPSIEDVSDPTAMIHEPPGQQKREERPQSLTLPFDNRERESHLVSEDEFDRIAREAQAENKLPPVPAHFKAELSEVALRRSISTAPDVRFSFLSGRSRPLSEDFENTALVTPNRLRTLNVGDRTAKAFRTLGLPRDRSSLTALPRAPTRDDLANYHAISQISQGPLTSYSDALCSHGKVVMPNLQAPLPFTPKTEGKNEKKGHKRGFSLSIASGGVFDSVKKRLKLSESSARAENTPASSSARFSTPGTSTPDPYVDSSETEDLSRYPTASSTATGQGIASGNIIDPDLHAPLASSPHILKSCADPKRSFLSRVFSRGKKQAAPRPRPTISSPLTMNPPSPVNTSPTRQARREADQAFIDALQIGLARRNASVSSPISHPLPGTSRGTSQPSTTQTQVPDPRIGTPEPRATSTEPRDTLPQPGVLGNFIPPTKAQLATTVARQQSRIQDLSALNSTLIGQVERLNTELGEFRFRDRARADPREQALGSPAEAGGRKWSRASSGDTQTGQVKRARDEEGDEKRKTWMTIDSE